MHADVLSHATLSDMLGGSIVSVDPNTGVTTTTSDNFSITQSDDEHDHEDETDVRSAGNPDQDTFSQTNTDPDEETVDSTETVTYTSQNGSQAAPPVVTSVSSSDTITAFDTM